MPETGLPSAAERPLNSKFVALLVGALAISMAPIFIKLSVSHGHIGYVAAGFWRVTLAAPFFFGLRALTGRSAHRAAVPRIRRTRDYLLLAVPGLFFAGDLATWHSAFAFTTLANATLLANLATVFVAIVGRVWLKERFTWLFPVGGGLALIGTAVLVGASHRLSADAVKGDLLAIITAVFYSGYILSIKLLRSKWDTATLMSWTTLACAAGLLPIALFLPGALGHHGGFWPTATYGWLALIGVALVSHCGGQGMIAYALAHLPASLSSVSLLVQPVSTAILSWFIFDQRLTDWQIGGGVIVLGGIFLARLGSRL